MYTSYLTGNPANAEARPRRGLVLAGGGADQDEAMKWLCERADGGDVLVLRASGSDGYNDYLYGLGTVDSVESVVLQEREAASDPQLLQKVAEADAIFFAGGDQARYLALMQGTPLQEELQGAVDRGVPVGGTSAGMALLGDPVFSARLGTVTSKEARRGERLTFDPAFLQTELENVVTDTHFSERDRMGRLEVFMLRTGARGLGVDEATAVLVDEQGMARVVGQGTATFAEAGQPPVVLRAGECFNVRSWKGVPA